STAEEDDLAVSGDLPGIGVQFFGFQADGAGDRTHIVVQPAAKVDDIKVFARVNALAQLLRGDAGSFELFEESAALDKLPDDPRCEHACHQNAEPRTHPLDS